MTGGWKVAQAIASVCGSIMSGFFISGFDFNVQKINWDETIIEGSQLMEQFGGSPEGGFTIRPSET